MYWGKLHIIIIVLTFTLFSCTNTVQSNMENESQSISGDTSGNFEFLYDCDDLEIWFGGIQGIPYSDSNIVYPLGECSSNKNYDLIWVPKGGFSYRKNLHPDSLRKMFYKDSETGFRNFNCFAFVINQKNQRPNNAEIEQFDYEFPADVEIYKNTDEGWRQKSVEMVHSFEDLGRLKIKTIFSE